MDLDLKKPLEYILSGGVELIIGILGALIGGILLYYWIVNKKSKSKKREILEGYLRDHSMDLVNEVFNIDGVVWLGCVWLGRCIKIFNIPPFYFFRLNIVKHTAAQLAP